MSPTDTRQHIIQTTVSLLREVDDPATITVRQIASRAGVGIGSINYNFGSKDELINEAVWQIVGENAANWYTPDRNPDIDPRTRLRRLLKEGARVMFQYRKYMEIGILHVIQNGQMSAKVQILPLLREIYDSGKSDVELRLVAFQLVASLEVAFLNSRQLGEFLGVDITQPETFDTIIDMAIDNLIGHGPEEDTK